MAECIGIVGAGRMGCGVAQVCAEAGLSVVFVDIRHKSLVNARKTIEESLNKKIADGSLKPEEKAAILSRIETSTEFSSLKKCKLCLEAVIENAGIKGSIHSRIRAAAGNNVIIASNTVSLSIAAFANRLPAPDRVIGMVFGFPPQTAKEVKLICGPKTSEETFNVAREIVRSIGKTHVPAPDVKIPARFPLPRRVRLVAIALFLVSVTICAANWFGVDHETLQTISCVGTGINIISLYVLLRIVYSRSFRLRGIARAMTSLAADDLSVVVPDTDKHDEYGDIARLVDIFKMISQSLDKSSDDEIRKAEEAEQKRKRLETFAHDFDENTAHLVEALANISKQMYSASNNVASLADQTNQQCTSVASATEEASSGVQTVASAAEELSASIGEIDRQVGESTRIAQEAVDEVTRTNATVSTLSEAATQIGDVVKLIQDIAEQTNLLALNATIEAARAGEAGKGFAVVASEVKNLANQTARATEEIAKKISTVQSVSVEAAEAIRTIGSTIEQINSISSAIAGAVKQQASATKEISSNVQQVSAGTNEVSSSISEVTRAAAESLSAAREMLKTSEEMSRQTETLRGEVKGFIGKVRQG